MNEGQSVTRLFFVLGALSALVAVGAGAFGAHLLRHRLSADMLANFQTAARYQMYHALALLAVAWAAVRWTDPLVSVAGWLFVTGTALFSGSLYVLSLSGLCRLGGVAFIAGWACLAWSVWRG
jgi:uncharacterized membrane protein YgdD (TMEM256/DUF423 family)